MKFQKFKKASELVDNLQKLIKEHGDKDVASTDSSFDSSEVELVGYDNDNEWFLLTFVGQINKEFNIIE